MEIFEYPIELVSLYKIVLTTLQISGIFYLNPEPTIRLKQGRFVVSNIFSMSDKYREQYPGVGFGLTLISGCRDNSNPPGFDQYKRKALRKMRKRETLAQRVSSSVVTCACAWSGASEAIRRSSRIDARRSISRSPRSAGGDEPVVGTSHRTGLR